MQRASNRVFNTAAQQNEIDALKQSVRRLDQQTAASNELLVAGGWTPVFEDWTYAGWTAGTRIGTITVPADATTRFSAGMRVYLNQPTDGVKLGIIVLVASTLLTIFFKEDIDLDNEGFANIYVSTHKAPLGFILDPDQWTLETISTTSRSTTSDTFATLTDALTVGPGAWKVSLSCYLHLVIAGNLDRNIWVTLSSDASTETNPKLTAGIGIGTTSGLDIFGSVYTEEHVGLAAATTYTLMGRDNGSSATLTTYDPALVDTTIRAQCAYL